MTTTATVNRHRPHLGRKRLRDLGIGLLFISPWLVGFLALQVYPFFASLFYSFTSYSTLEPPRWIGIVNYIQLWEDPRFRTALFNSAYYGIFAVMLNVAGGFLMAVLLNLRMRARSVFRTIFFLPSVTPLVATAVIWLWMFNPQSGVINSLLRLVGVEGPAWLGDPSWSKPALILMSLWSVGTSMLIFLAALQDVPKDMLEAAEIDGAGPLRKMWHITLPVISPVTLFILITGLISALQFFTEVHVMTGGAGSPADSTLMLSIYLWQTAFENFNMGYAAAQAWFLFLLLVMCTALLFRLTRRRVFYGG